MSECYHLEFEKKTKTISRRKKREAGAGNGSREIGRNGGNVPKACAGNMEVANVGRD